MIVVEETDDGGLRCGEWVCPTFTNNTIKSLFNMYFNLQIENEFSGRVSPRSGRCVIRYEFIMTERELIKLNLR